MGLTDLLGAMKRKDLPVVGRQKKRHDRLNVATNKFLLTGEGEEPRALGFHVSEMCFFCPRKFVLDILVPENVKPREIDVGLQRIFDAGHIWHDAYQNRYLGPAGILKGTWECLRCDHQHEGFMPIRCASCKKGRRYLQFKEPHVVDRSLGVVVGGIEWVVLGHSDGVISLGEDEEDQVLELKSMDSDKWEKLEEPLFWNVHQIQIYMHMMEMARGRLVYINKNTNQTKEFMVQYDPGPWHNVESKIGSLKLFFRKVEENKGVVKPEWVSEVRGSCKDVTSHSAKTCPQVAPCFDRKTTKTTWSLKGEST